MRSPEDSNQLARSDVAAMRARGQASLSKNRSPVVSGACLGLLVAVCLVSGGCDDLGAILGDIEEELRGNEVAEGRAGTLRALHVAKTAADLARAHSRRPDEACALAMPQAGYVYSVELVMTREARIEKDLSWTESRRFIRDARGNRSLEMNADYGDGFGQTGSHTRLRMVIDDVAYDGADPDHFYRREADGELRRALQEAGLSPMQTLLNSVDGWSRAEGSRTWEMGGSKLTCGPQDAGERAWLERLATRGDIVSARFEVEDEGRRIDLRWLLEDGVVMQVHATDRVTSYDGLLEKPAEDRIVDVERDRSWTRANDLLSRLEEQGAIRRIPSTNDRDAN